MIKRRIEKDKNKQLKPQPQHDHHPIARIVGTVF
jgi:hypothetical protein